MLRHLLRTEFYRTIQKPRLCGKPHRFGLIKRRHGYDLTQFAETADGPIQVRGAIAQVGTEREVDVFVHESSFPIPAFGFHKKMLVLIEIRCVFELEPALQIGNYLGYFLGAGRKANINDMPLESLLVSRDPQVIRVLRPALEKLAIEVEVCRGADSGSEILASEKFDAVIVDCDDLHGGLGLLETLRGTTSNRNSVTFAILNGHTTTREAFQMGANFVLQKPISPVNAARCFSAAIGLMSRERRRYFRQPVEMPVTLVFGEGQELKATATNLSEGGMAVFFRGKFPKGGLSKALFRLPGGEMPLETKAQIAWIDGTGRAGVRFIEMPKTTREQLDCWLTKHSEKSESMNN